MLIDGKNSLPQQESLLGEMRGDKHGTVFYNLVLMLPTGCQESVPDGMGLFGSLMASISLS